MACHDCSVVRMVYLVPVEVTVDLDLEMVMSARMAKGYPIEPTRVIEDDKHRAARRIAEGWEWPGW